MSLARAVFSDRDIYLLDDPLSAVDQHVGNRLFKKCIRGILRGKTVIFVTNQLQYLSKCDRIILLDGGKIAEMGTYHDLIASGGEFAQMVQDHVSKEKDEIDESESSTQESRKKSSKSRSPSKEPEKIDAAKGKLIVAEDKVSGKYEHSTSLTYVPVSHVILACLSAFLHPSMLTTSALVAGDSALGSSS